MNIKIVKCKVCGKEFKSTTQELCVRCYILDLRTRPNKKREQK